MRQHTRKYETEAEMNQQMMTGMGGNVQTSGILRHRMQLQSGTTTTFLTDEELKRDGILAKSSISVV